MVSTSVRSNKLGEESILFTLTPTLTDFLRSFLFHSALLPEMSLRSAVTQHRSEKSILDPGSHTQVPGVCAKDGGKELFTTVLCIIVANPLRSDKGKIGI